jgi:RHS repeat-associated protein
MRRALLTLIALGLWPTLALAQTTTQVVEYYHTDALGSVRAVTKKVSGQWQVVSRHDFMPFGEEVSPQNPPQDKRLFTGKERDQETGQDYFGARYYRADLGRFATVDPLMTIEENLVDPQRWNRYAYARDNPLKYVDPDGRTVKVSGDDSQRAWILGQARDAVGAKAGQYLNLTWNEKLDSWELSVQGVTMEAFQAMNPVAFDFGMTIASPTSVTVKVSSERLPGDDAAFTFDIGQRNGSREPVILLNHPGKDMAVAQFGRTVATAWMYEDSRTRIPGQMIWGITLAHELGHAWGINVGWGTAKRDENNIALALAWENRARQLAYGPNTPRRKHHR